MWDDTNGLIDGGLAEAISGADTSTEASGVLATLTFIVTGYGDSGITLAGGNLRASSSDSTGVNVTCNSATVNVLKTASSSSSPSPSGSSSSPSVTATITPSSTMVDSTPASIPEFPSWLILVFLIALALATLSTLSYLRKKKIIQPFRSV